MFPLLWEFGNDDDNPCRGMVPVETIPAPHASFNEHETHEVENLCILVLINEKNAFSAGEPRVPNPTNQMRVYTRIAMSI